MNELRLPPPRNAGREFKRPPTHDEVRVAEHYVDEMITQILKFQRASYFAFCISYSCTVVPCRLNVVSQIIKAAANGSGWQCELEWQGYRGKNPLTHGSETLKVKLVEEVQS